MRACAAVTAHKGERVKKNAFAFPLSSDWRKKISAKTRENAFSPLQMWLILSHYQRTGMKSLTRCYNQDFKGVSTGRDVVQLTREAGWKG